MPASDYEALYSTARWHRIRAQHLQLSAICIHCWRDRHIVTPASEVHHRRKHQGDRKAFFVVSHDDLESLCRRCHSTMTAIERGWKVRASPDQDGWPTEPPISAPTPPPSASRVRRALKAARDARRGQSASKAQGAVTGAATSDGKGADDIAALLLP